MPFILGRVFACSTRPTTDRLLRATPPTRICPLLVISTYGTGNNSSNAVLIPSVRMYCSCVLKKGKREERGERREGGERSHPEEDHGLMADGC